MIPKKLYVRELDIDIFDEEVNVTRAWVANKPCTGRREYTDLSQVWHPAEEVPEKDRWVISKDKYGKIAVFKWDNQIHSWSGFAAIFELRIWAYADDLIPKGGEE